MNRLAALIVAMAFAAALQNWPVQAQAPSPAQMGITPTATQILNTLDSTRTWAPMGTVDPSKHAFTGFGAGTDVRAFGCFADGATDQTACINNALANASDCVIIPASTSGFYVAGTITVPRCLRGTALIPSAAAVGFSGSSFLLCNNQAAQPCVVVNRSGNAAAQVENLTLAGSGATPAAGSIGFKWLGGYGLQQRDLQVVNFDTCAYYGPITGPGLGPITAHLYGTFFSRCQKHYVVADGVAELYFVNGRWGENGGADYDADDFLYATKTTNAGAAGGPNTIILDNMQLNPGNHAIGCAFRWGGFTGTGGLFGSNKIANSHIEIASGATYAGSAPRGFICIDATVPVFPGLDIVNSEFNEDGTKSMPFFNIDPAVPFNSELRFANSILCGASLSLTIKNLTGAHAPAFVNNYICGSANTFTAGDTSAQLMLTNNTFNTYTLAGAWPGFLSLIGNLGTLTDNATGAAIFEAGQQQRLWTPALTASGGGTFAYTTQGGTWSRGANGGLWGYFNIVLSNVTGASGNISITGFPKVCAGRALAGAAATYSGFSGLASAPWGTFTAGQASISLLQAGAGAGSVSVTATNLTATSSISGVVTCGLAQ